MREGAAAGKEEQSDPHLELEIGPAVLFAMVGEAGEAGEAGERAEDREGRNFDQPALQMAEHGRQMQKSLRIGVSFGVFRRNPVLQAWGGSFHGSSGPHRPRKSEISRFRDPPLRIRRITNTRTSFAPKLAAGPLREKLGPLPKTCPEFVEIEPKFARVRPKLPEVGAYIARMQP